MIKKTFVLDFVNDYKDMEAAFSKYYTITLLSNSVTPGAIYDIEAKIDGYAIIDPMDIDDVNDLLYQDNISAKEKRKITFILQKTKKNIENLDIDEQREFVAVMRRFTRFYEFLLQASCFEDVELHKKI